MKGNTQKICNTLLNKLNTAIKICIVKSLWIWTSRNHCYCIAWNNDKPYLATFLFHAHDYNAICLRTAVLPAFIKTYQKNIGIAVKTCIIASLPKRLALKVSIINFLLIGIKLTAPAINLNGNPAQNSNNYRTNHHTCQQSEKHLYPALAFHGTFSSDIVSCDAHCLSHLY